MLTKLISKDDALALVNRTESHFFDFKAKEVSGAKVQRALVAFGNADGGELAVGIADAKEGIPPLDRWQGHASIEDFNGVLQAINGIQPTVPCSTAFLACQDLPGVVLYVRVDKSSSVHKTSGNEVFIRKGAQCLPITDPARLTALQFEKGLASYEDVAVGNVPPETIVEGPHLKAFLQDFSPKTAPLEFCVNENLIDLKTWDPKVCGLVLYAPKPSAVIPTRAGVRVSRYETKEDDPERDHLANSHLLEEPAYDLIHHTIDLISKIMSDISIWTVDGLQKVAYPPEAIWEVVVNAIIHRDYAIADDVQVRIFDNRIEIESPGKLPGFVTVDNILDVRYSRNKQIVRTLARYKTPPNRDMGEGLNTAFQKMKDWKLRPPTIQESANAVVVTIPHSSLAKPEELVMEFIGKHGTITNKQGRELTGIKSENQMKNVFYGLRDTGKIVMIPKGNKTEWKLT
jgi:ATP-dependent DNA helicase RecG